MPVFQFLYQRNSFKRVLFFALILISITALSHAQPSFEEGDIIRQYDSQKYYFEYLPTVTGSGSAFGTAFDLEARRRVIEHQLEVLTPRVEVKPITISLVFHFLVSTEIEDIESLVSTQIRALNRDFNQSDLPESHPNDPQGQYVNLAASSKIEFVAARIEETIHGDGIATIRQIIKPWRSYDEMKDTKNEGVRPIQPEKLINIWVVDMPDNLASYATSPYQNSHNAGIVIDQRFFGERPRGEHKYLQGKSLTHLIGNYLGLKDLWNRYEYCKDDYVDDTPIHNAPNRGNPRHKHITTCETHKIVPEMTMNFMDATDDEHQIMFTRGQVQRMHAMLHVARKTLIDSSLNQ